MGRGRKWGLLGPHPEGLPRRKSMHHRLVQRPSSPALGLFLRPRAYVSPDRSLPQAAPCLHNGATYILAQDFGLNSVLGNLVAGLFQVRRERSRTGTGARAAEITVSSTPLAAAACHSLVRLRNCTGEPRGRPAAISELSRYHFSLSPAPDKAGMAAGPPLSALLLLAVAVCAVYFFRLRNHPLFFLVPSGRPVLCRT